MTTLCLPSSSLLWAFGADGCSKRSALLWYFNGFLNLESGFGAKSYELLAFFIPPVLFKFRFNFRFNPFGWSFRFTFMLMEFCLLRLFSLSDEGKLSFPSFNTMSSELFWLFWSLFHFCFIAMVFLQMKITQELHSNDTLKHRTELDTREASQRTPLHSTIVLR